MEPLPNVIVGVFMTFPILVRPNWKQERRFFRYRLLQFILFIVLNLLGLYALPPRAFTILVIYGATLLLFNVWAIRTSYPLLPTLNLFGDQAMTLFLLSLSSAGNGPFIFLLYLHVLSAIIFTGQRNIIIVFTLMQFFNLTLATLLSQLTPLPGSWQSVLFHAIGLFIINLFGIRPAEDLHQDAQTDPLTKALNRRSGFGKLETWLNEERAFSLLVLDVKRFKEVNDKHGHNIGDEVLKLIAQTLRESVRDDDLVIRHGGDEFLVATRGTHEPLIERLQQKLTQNIQERLGELAVTIDIGTATYPQEAQSLQTLMEIADQKMYQAKRA
jgi:diguanylate cyclase (GGDEF)-like protein